MPPWDRSYTDTFKCWSDNDGQQRFGYAQERFFAAFLLASEADQEDIESLMRNHLKLCDHLEKHLVISSTSKEERSLPHEVYYVHPLFRALIVLMRPYDDPEAIHNNNFLIIRTGDDRKLCTGPINLTNFAGTIAGGDGLNIISTNLPEAVQYITALERQEALCNPRIIEARRFRDETIETQIQDMADGLIEIARRFGVYADWTVEMAFAKVIVEARQANGFPERARNQVLPYWKYEYHNTAFTKKIDTSRTKVVTATKLERTMSLPDLADL